MLGIQEVILILTIVLVLVGPAKLPKIARDLGLAVREFQKASSNIMETATSALEIEDENNNNQLLEIAEKLGINTEGKTTKQLVTEINTKIDNTKEETK